MNRKAIYISLTAVSAIVLFILNLLVGAADIPVSDVINIITGREQGHEGWQYIVMESRLPQAITATLGGASLAVCGLMLQVAFRNPLAGPSVFGINSGASLGVAIVMLLPGVSMSAGTISVGNFMAIIIAAFTGAMTVMFIILLFSVIVRNNVMLLIIGIMTGYIASSAISLLNFIATSEGVQSYMVWGLGNFGGVTMNQIPLFSAVTISGLVCSLFLIKPLNALLLGEQYAGNLGVRTVRVRNVLMIVTGLLTATTTAFCGPVSFIGLAVPHIARIFLSTDNHRTVMPATMLTGMAVALLCNLICVMPWTGGVLPLNAVTPLIGAPVIIYVITRRRA